MVSHRLPPSCPPFLVSYYVILEPEEAFDVHALRTRRRVTLYRKLYRQIREAEGTRLTREKHFATHVWVQRRHIGYHQQVLTTHCPYARVHSHPKTDVGGRMSTMPTYLRWLGLRWEAPES